MPGAEAPVAIASYGLWKRAGLTTPSRRAKRPRERSALHHRGDHAQRIHGGERAPRTGNLPAARRFRFHRESRGTVDDPRFLQEARSVHPDADRAPQGRDHTGRSRSGPEPCRRGGGTKVSCRVSRRRFLRASGASDGTEQRPTPGGRGDNAGLRDARHDGIGAVDRLPEPGLAVPGSRPVATARVRDPARPGRWSGADRATVHHRGADSFCGGWGVGRDARDVCGKRPGGDAARSSALLAGPRVRHASRDGVRNSGVLRDGDADVRVWAGASTLGIGSAGGSQAAGR